MVFNVMMDGDIIKSYDNKESAELHAAKINQQAIQWDKEAYVEAE